MSGYLDTLKSQLTHINDEQKCGPEDSVVIPTGKSDPPKHTERHFFILPPPVLPVLEMPFELEFPTLLEALFDDPNEKFDNMLFAMSKLLSLVFIVPPMVLTKGDDTTGDLFGGVLRIGDGGESEESKENESSRKMFVPGLMLLFIWLFSDWRPILFIGIKLFRRVAGNLNIESDGSLSESRRSWIN